MGVYLVLLLSITVFALIMRTNRGMPRDSKFLMASLGAMFLVVALRAPTVGTDTLGYRQQYLSHYVRSDELGFSKLMELATATGLGFQGFLAVVALITFGALYVICRTFALAPFLSVMLILGTGLFAMSMSGLRQTLAASVFLLAIVALDGGRRWLFVALVLLASTFHNSAIVLLPIVFMSSIRFSRSGATVCLLAIGLLATQGYLVSNVMGAFGLDKYDPYLDESTAQINLITVAIAAMPPVMAVLLWPIDRVVDNDAESAQNRTDARFSLLYGMSALNLLVAGLATAVPITSRMTYYFVPLSAILVGNIVSLSRDRIASSVSRVAVPALAILLFVWTAPGSSLGILPYHFYWSQT
jgi:hypothetical protein